MRDNLIFTDKQLDGLTEIINVGVGYAAATLNEMIATKIELETPRARIIDLNHLESEGIAFADKSLSCVNVAFEGENSGFADLIFPKESAANLVNVITKGEFRDADMNDIKAQTLEEVGNIVINGIMGSIGNLLKTTINFSVPVYDEGSLTTLMNSRTIEEESKAVLVEHFFKVRSLEIEGTIIVIFRLASFKKILHAIDQLFD